MVIDPGTWLPEEFGIPWSDPRHPFHVEHMAMALEEAAAAGKPVFVDFTAAWCITCLVNERVALETAAARQAFEKTGTVKLKGDWTNRDPEITAVLKEVGRAGVPLYLYWPPKADKPKVLPQVLTEALILSELGASR